MKKDFNEFRFAGLNYRVQSNKYFTMDRVSEDEKKIVVKVADEHLVKTKYGYALVLDYNHVVFVKEWAVSANYFGNEVMLTEEYFTVKEWGTFDDFGEEEENLEFDTWVNVAKEQEAAENIVRWEK